ncbi:GHKL domain-containing protein [Bacillus sp. IB182487]|uniref:histidine kinase n=1 Tax=Metabacillus arenae TaxID=2771434 RepID=A0A926RWR4_9BACI|nr:GHKL domain-containing protein [Metabacillus arenae]
MGHTSKNLIDFLEENVSVFVQSWLERVIISDTDFHKDEVKKNGIAMYELVKQTIRNPLSSREIGELANLVAIQRVEADVNISDFVYNVNLGRSEIIKHMYRSNISFEKLQPYLEEVNDLFDQFSYVAVKKYTEIKEKELNDKNIFIDQTHKERLTILGQMASTFVHEFRNPLTAAIGFIKLIQQEQPNLKYLDIVSHELKELNYRISQFLHVSKKEVLENKREEFSLYNLFDDMFGFIYPSLLDGDVEIHSTINHDIILYANKGELRQVFLNIILNFIDALKNVDGERKITIDYILSDNEVKLILSNNGPIIPEKNIATIFEPFYTTKELGTGIGLYICKKIIENHNGHISCESSHDKTSFIITLPLN